MGQTPNRKKNFSISMKPIEIERIDKHVQELTKESRFPVTRNELIRHIILEYLDSIDKKDSE